MKNFRSFIAGSLIVLLICAPGSLQANPGEYPHIITGYGAISGDLFSPNSSAIFNDSLYILDNFGISVYDLATKQLKNKFPVDLGRSDKKWQDPKTWVSFVQNFRDGFMGMMEGLLPGKRIGDFPGYSESDEIKPDITFDSKGNLYSLTKEGIKVINRENGQILNTIPLPQMVNQKNITYALKIYEDQFYLLQAEYDLTAFQIQKSATLFIFSLDGKLVKEIKIDLSSEIFVLMSTDFIVLPAQKIFALVNVNYREERLTTPIQFFGWDGKMIDTEGSNHYGIVPTAIEMLDQNKVLLSGFRLPQRNYAEPITLNIPFHREELGSYFLEDATILQSDLFGLKAIDLSVTNGKISLVSTGKLDSIMDNRILLMQDNIPTERFGSSPYREGQIFGSIACAVDEEKNLYETSFRSSVINIYNKQGVYLSNIEMDLDEMSSLCGCLSVSPMILDMTVDDEYLYCTNLFPNSINRYSFETKKWKQLFWEDMAIRKIHLWLNIRSQEENLYLLDSASLNNGSPNLAYLDSHDNLVDIFLKGSPPFYPSNPPLFIGFTMTNEEYQFLDCIHNEIWIFDRVKEEFIQKIKIPQENGFSTSFEVLSDGSWIVTDVIHNLLLHVSKAGELIEKIGKSGVVKQGFTKREFGYLEEYFNRPVRVKVFENRIYVSDLMNCRYHMILLEPDPDIIWNYSDLDQSYKEFDLFEDIPVDIEYEVVGSRDFNYRITSKASWIKLSTMQGNTKERKISFTLLGSLLKPWENNLGLIEVKFPSYPLFNKKFPIEAFAKGNTVKVRINGTYASVNDHQITLEPGMSPILRNNRTFVGARFMNDIVFKKLSTISYDPKTQTVLFALKEKKIELTIGKTFALVNGEKVELDVAPFISNGRTYIPLRFVSENLDASVEFDPIISELTIFYPRKNK
jgi:hypothetical protein